MRKQIKYFQYEIDQENSFILNWKNQRLAKKDWTKAKTGANSACPAFVECVGIMYTSLSLGKSIPLAFLSTIP